MFEHGDGVISDSWGMGWRLGNGPCGNGKSDDWQILIFANTTGLVLRFEVLDYVDISSRRRTTCSMRFDWIREGDKLPQSEKIL